MEHEVRRAAIANLNPGQRRLFDCCVDLDYRARNTIGNAIETRRWAEMNGFDATFGRGVEAIGGNPRAAELAGQGQAQQAHLAELGPQVLREPVVLVDVRRARRDLALGEAADRD